LLSAPSFWTPPCLYPRAAKGFLSLASKHERLTPTWQRKNFLRAEFGHLLLRASFSVILTSIGKFAASPNHRAVADGWMTFLRICQMMRRSGGAKKERSIC